MALMTGAPAVRDSILVTHLNCMDGSGCAIMFLNAGGKFENIRFVAAGQLEKRAKIDKIFDGPESIIVADLSCGPEFADELEKRGNVVIIDHHATALHLKNRPWCIIDMEACGTELMRRYFDIEHLGFKELSANIDDFDRWKRQRPVGDEMSLFHSFYGQKAFVKDFEFPDTRFRGVSPWMPHERELIRNLQEKRTKKAKQLADGAKIKQIMSLPRSMEPGPIYGAYVISSDPNNSVILDAVLARHPKVHVAVQINPETRLISLRSRPDFDCSELAKLYGGGGHPHACGHLLPSNLLEELIEGVHP